MSAIKLGRALLRGFARAVNVKASEQLTAVANYGSIAKSLTLSQRSWFLGQNLKSFCFNSAAALIRRQASNNFVRGFSRNFCLVSFVSYSMKENEDRTYQDTRSLTSMVEGIKASFKNAIQADNEESEHFSSNMSDYEVQERLGERSCNSAVYKASCNGKECALKVMFNYDTSSSEAIYKAFCREFQVLSSATKNDTAQKHTATHPNIMKLHGKFIDKNPILYDSIESYPQALPRQEFQNAFGRSQTLFLVMPKYSCTLREYLEMNVTSLNFQTQFILFQQLLEGVTCLEQNGISHRDLKSDNILVNPSDDDQPQLVITDFGCCLVNESMHLPYETDYVDKGGNMNLMAPEIAAALPGKEVVLDYTKADAWAVGALAYEIFGQENPFYHLCNRNYTQHDIPALNTGHHVLDVVVQHLLQTKPEKRFSASQASTILFLVTFAPELFSSNLDELTKDDVNRWFMKMAIITIRNCLLNGISAENQVVITFLSRATVEEIIDDIIMMKKLT